MSEFENVETLEGMDLDQFLAIARQTEKELKKEYGDMGLEDDSGDSEILNNLEPSVEKANEVEVKDAQITAFLEVVDKQEMPDSSGASVEMLNSPEEQEAMDTQ